MPISTLVPRKTKEDGRLADLLDRKLTLSSRSLRFLAEHDFDMQHALGAGVPCLARGELRLAMERFFSAPGAGEAVDLSALGEFDAGFCRELRGTLRAWLRSAPKAVRLVQPGPVSPAARRRR